MLGERIRYMRNELSMTMKELGEKVGLTESAIGMIERGERSTQINQIERISNALNVSPAWLVGWEGGRQMSEYQKNSMKHVTVTKDDGELIASISMQNGELIGIVQNGYKVSADGVPLLKQKVDKTKAPQ